MRETAQIVTVNLPLPPSVNKAFSARRGSHLTMKTAAYRFWERQVYEEHPNGGALPRLKTGHYGFWLDLPAGMRGDIDNRIKLLSDVLRDKGLGAVIDDGDMKGLYVGFCVGLANDRCAVTVVTLPAWPAYVCMRIEP